ncbi:MAG TPA: glycosyltransferase [Myxococcaceae bacterium]|nr:glycosyltransferase [Myxococcaceae bacterium]
MMNTVLIALAVLALLLLLEGHVRLSRVLRRRRSPPPLPTTGPSITVIRPVRGLDPGAEDNIRAFLDMEYPGRLELLFVVDSVEDPAYPAIQRLIAEHPTGAQRVELLLSGTPPPRRTGKLNAMLVGVAAATGELLAFNDSDSRPSTDLLGRLVSELLARPDCGCTFAPVVASAARPTASDVGYGLLVNAWYGPNVTWAAEPRGELDFIMGQLMVCRRQALDAVGGVGVAEGQFVDDMYIGRALWKAGWKNVVIHAPLRLVIGGMGPLTFFRTFRRWILFSEGGLSFRFTWPGWVRGISCWIAWGVLVTAGVTGRPGIAALALAPIAFSIWTQAALQRGHGGPSIALHQLWVPAVLPLLSGVVALAARLNRRVDWRGRSYDLDADARLGTSGSPAAGA